MRIIAFSDYRVQDIQKTAKFVASMSPDVILYAGDDVERLGPLDGNAMAKLLARNRSEQTGIYMCRSLDHESWGVTPCGEIQRRSVYSLLYDVYYFHLNIPGPVTEQAIIDKMSDVLNEGQDDSQPSTMLPMQRFANHAGLPVESLLKKASIYFKQTPSGAEGTISIRPENYVQMLASASKHGFGAVLGNDDDPVYKAVMNGGNAFDLHDRPISVSGFTIIGQEGATISDGRGIGRLIYAEDEVESHLGSLPQPKDGSRLILVTHTPPYRILDRAMRFGSDHIGSTAVRGFITKREPLLVFCGHVHSHGGCETRIGKTTVINLASHDSVGSPGRVCVVDISHDLKVTTKWFLVLSDRVVDYSARLLEEGETLNSVINMHGVGCKKAQALELNGIRTVKDVSAAGVAGLVRCGIVSNTAQKMVKKAESLLGRKAVQLAPLLIPKAPLMFVDIETDLAQSYVWLISVLVEGKPDSFRWFYAETPADEKDILREFLSYYDGFRGCVICYYAKSGFDERVIKNQITAYNLDGSRLGNWFDLCVAVENSIALPTSSHTLKEVADYFGYAYKHQDMDGFGAAMEYAHNIGERDESTTQKLLEYGKDDVMSLDHIISNIDRVAGIAPDRSWKPPKHVLPASFEEECALLKSLQKEGLTTADIAGMFGKSKPYIGTRLRAAPEEVKGRNVTFDQRYASDIGFRYTGKYKRGLQARGEDHKMRGVVVGQVSQSVFRVRASGTVFQVSGKFIDWGQ